MPFSKQCCFARLVSVGSWECLYIGSCYGLGITFSHCLQSDELAMSDYHNNV